MEIFLQFRGRGREATESAWRTCVWMKPINSHNRPVQSKRLEGLAKRVERQGVEKSELPDVQQELFTASRQALTAFEKVQPTRENRRKLGAALSAANRVLACSVATQTGTAGPIGVALANFESKNQLGKLLGLEFDQSVAGVETDVKRRPLEETQWVEVPAGEFQFGPDKNKVDLPAYRISKYPVTNRDFQKFVSETGYETQGNWKPPEGGYAEGDKNAEKPCVHVNFHDAKAYAKWAGGRLPTEQEWEKAARGTDGRLYPWGNEWRPEACNNEGSDLTPVNAFEKAGNVSPFGAVDMVGNAMEWVDSGTIRRPGAVLLKGGAWQNYRSPGADQLADPFGAVRHTSEYPDSTYAGFGFRIVTDETPQKAQSLPTTAPSQPLAILSDEAEGKTSGQSGKAEEESGLEKQLRQAFKNLTSQLPRSEEKPGKNLGVLAEAVRSARELRPLGGASDTKAARGASDTLHATANRVATLVGAAASGSVPLTLALKELEKHESSMLDSARVLQSAPRTSLRPEDGSKPADKMFEWLDIPEGKALVGRNNDEVHVKAFQLSKHPVTNDQFREFVQSMEYEVEGGWRAPEDGQYSSKDLAKEPAVNVSFNDARAFCEWAGCRLPEENEWEKAARGEDGATYNFAFVPSSLVADSGVMQPVDKVQESSPYGAKGMIGNVLEWVEGTTERRPGSVLLKGGAWSNGGVKPFTPERHSTDLPNSSYGGFGFRVAR